MTHPSANNGDVYQCCFPTTPPPSCFTQHVSRPLRCCTCSGCCDWNSSQVESLENQLWHHQQQQGMSLALGCSWYKATPHQITPPKPTWWRIAGPFACSPPQDWGPPARCSSGFSCFYLSSPHSASTSVRRFSASAAIKQYFRGTSLVATEAYHCLYIRSKVSSQQKWFGSNNNFFHHTRILT